MGPRVAGGMLDYFNQVLIQICLKEINEGHWGCLVLAGDQGGKYKRKNKDFLAGIKTFKLLTFI